MHCSIDLETLSVEARPVILSIGLFAFDPDAHDVFDSVDRSRGLALYPEIESQISMGRHMSWSTTQWWLGQDAKARQDVVDAERTSSDLISIALSDFFSTHSIEAIWGNGKEFDVVHLNSLLTDFGYNEMPVEFWNQLDLRTLKWTAENESIPKPTSMTAHSALDDAIWQGILVQIYRRMIA